MSGYREEDRYYDQQSQVFAHPNYGSYGGYSYGYGAYPAQRQRQQNYSANTVEEPRVRRVSGRNQPAAITMWSDRTWWAIFLLGIITCGIVDIVFWYRTANDLNIMESRYDGKRTMGFLMMLIFCTFTLFFCVFCLDAPLFGSGRGCAREAGNRIRIRCRNLLGLGCFRNSSARCGTVGLLCQALQGNEQNLGRLQRSRISLIYS